MFKGTVATQASITVRLEVDADAKGPAVVAVAWSGGGNTGAHDECYGRPRRVVHCDGDARQEGPAAGGGRYDRPAEPARAWRPVAAIEGRPDLASLATPE